MVSNFLQVNTEGRDIIAGVSARAGCGEDARWREPFRSLARNVFNEQTKDVCRNLT